MSTSARQEAGGSADAGGWKDAGRAMRMTQPVNCGSLSHLINIPPVQKHKGLEIFVGTCASRTVVIQERHLKPVNCCSQQPLCNLTGFRFNELD